jgi:zinc transport system ATP-binding protein
VAADVVVAVDRVGVDLGTGPVLDDVSLRVRRGDVVAILGANGSGKSSLLRAVLGLVPITRGRIELLGIPIHRFDRWDRIGYVPQRVTAGAGVPATVEEVVRSGRLNQRTWWRRVTPNDRAAVAEAIEAVGLGGAALRSVRQLSGGQQQRVLIARALVRQPDLLLLDEPTAGVDRNSQQAFAGALRRLVAGGTTVVLVLHELGWLSTIIRRSIVLRGGQVVHDGGPPVPRAEHAGPGHDHVHPHAAVDEGFLW